MSDLSLEDDESWLLPHFFLSALIRMSLVGYGLFHDQVFTLKYTDIDYSVFTDGALFVREGRSPFLRDGYRYTPFLAYFMTPNIVVTRVWGKIIFVIFDLLTGYLIYKVLTRLKRLVSQNAAVSSTLLWLYNPLPLVVSTRGSSDSIETFLVLWVFYLLTKKNNFFAGVIFGLSIHVKMYPVIYAIGIFFLLRRHDDHEEEYVNYPQEGRSRVASSSMSSTMDSTHSATFDFSRVSGGDNCLRLWNPLTRERISFFTATAVSFTIMTGLAYYWYGQKYLNEAWLYHFHRKDAQHNFSVYFYIYHMGLSPVLESLLSRVAFIPQVLVILFTVKKYMLSKEIQVYSTAEGGSDFSEVSDPSCSLSEETTFVKFFFASFCQTFMFVHLNKVITSQYFLWYLCLFPLVFPFLHGIRGGRHLRILFLWLTGQGVWLFTAYLYEFQRIEAALPFVWAASLLFLVINLYIVKTYQKGFDAMLIRRTRTE